MTASLDRHKSSTLFHRGRRQLPPLQRVTCRTVKCRISPSQRLWLASYATNPSSVWLLCSLLVCVCTLSPVLTSTLRLPLQALSPRNTFCYWQSFLPDGPRLPNSPPSLLSCALRDPSHKVGHSESLLINVVLCVTLALNSADLLPWLFSLPCSIVPSHF